jgi:hypothetical protein
MAMPNSNFICGAVAERTANPARRRAVGTRVKGDGKLTASEAHGSQPSGESTKAVFSSFKILKILQDFPSHQILGRMHGALNVGKKMTNCTVCL